MRCKIVGLLFWVLSVAALAAGDSEKRILIDPGHGGQDSGVIVGHMKEKDIALDLSGRLFKELNRRGYRAEMTRHDDHFIPLKKRSTMIEKLGADLLVSIHANAVLASENDRQGIEIYTAKETPMVQYPLTLRPSKILAEKVAMAFQQNDASRKVIIDNASFWLLVASPVPAILIESGYVSDETDAQLLGTPSYLDELAEAIADGIDVYYAQSS